MPLPNVQRLVVCDDVRVALYADRVEVDGFTPCVHAYDAATRELRVNKARDRTPVAAVQRGGTATNTLVFGDDGEIAYASTSTSGCSQIINVGCGIDVLGPGQSAVFTSCGKRKTMVTSGVHESKIRKRPGDGTTYSSAPMVIRMSRASRVTALCASGTTQLTLESCVPFGDALGVSVTDEARVRIEFGEGQSLRLKTLAMSCSASGKCFCASSGQIVARALTVRLTKDACVDGVCALDSIEGTVRGTAVLHARIARLCIQKVVKKPTAHFHGRLLNAVEEHELVQESTSSSTAIDLTD
jgi:hypothetical protein